MFKSILQESQIKKIIIHATLLLGLFLLIVGAFNNEKRTLVLVMECARAGEAQIYFRGENENYRESKSAFQSKISGKYQYFKLPQGEKIDFLRIDPMSSQGSVVIEDIFLMENVWFKEKIYEISIQSLQPLHMIDDFHCKGDDVYFSSSGDDPYLEVKCYPELKESITNFRISYLVICLLFYFLLFYLVKIYGRAALDVEEGAKLLLYSLFFALFVFKLFYYLKVVKFGFPPDETAHYYYIDHLRNTKALIPEFADMRSFYNDELIVNYLCHPPLYYYLVSFMAGREFFFLDQIGALRNASAIISLISYLICVGIVFREKLNLASHFTYLTFITSIPMFAYLGASINNDNLAILAGALFLLGVKKILENSDNNNAFSLLLTGALLAFFAKLTAAILVFVAALLTVFYLYKDKQRISFSRDKVIIVFLGMVLVCAYQWTIFHRYHSILPTLGARNPEYFKQSIFFIPEAKRYYLNVYDWFLRFLHYMQKGWFGIQSHHCFYKTGIWEISGLLILHLCAFLSIFMPFRDSHKNFYKIGRIGVLAMFVVGLIQFFYSYVGHLRTGYMGGLQARYLLPLMPSLGILASLLVERGRKNILFWLLLVCINIHAIYYDIFYFMKFYS